MRSLGNRIYTDPKILEIEKREIFSREWLCVGRSDAISEPGQYLTYQVNNQPIAIIRQEDGNIRAFSNVCIHRMMLLLPERSERPRLRKRFACPYHGWTYALDGRLVGAPHMQEIKEAGFRLPELACSEWAGFVFVSLAQNPPCLSTRLEDLTAAVAPYRPETYLEVLNKDSVWCTNWKILAENFMESYHLPFAHRETVGAWCPIQDVTFPKAANPAFTYQTFPKRLDAIYGVASPGNKHLEGHRRYTSVMPTIYPSTMFVLAPDHLWWLSLSPHTVDKVHVRLGVSIAPDRLDTVDDLEAYLKTTSAFFDLVNEEDRSLVEAVYRGAQAPLASPGPLSWLERSIQEFHNYLGAIYQRAGCDLYNFSRCDAE